MFCLQCGKQIEDGKSFCKFCGARVNAEPEPTPPQAAPPVSSPVPQQVPQPTPPPPIQPPPSPPQAPAPALPGDADATPVGLPPLPSADSVQQKPAVAPPVAPASPVTPPNPPAAEYGGPPAKGRPRWVVPLLAVIGVLIVTSFIVLAVLLLGLPRDRPKATDPVSTGTGSLTPLTPTTVSPTPGTSAGGGVLTTATIPRYDPDATKTPPTVPTSEDQAAYVSAVDNLERVLSRADSRVPVLAVEINNTAPRVSKSVEEELGRLQQDVENAQGALGSHDPPQRFQRADELIFNAADEMLYRIDQTRQGIDAMWRAGTVDAGTPYFDAGRVARDQFRTLFDQYRSTRP